MSALARFRQAFDLSGKTAVVIGAGSGIGQQAAYGLAARGAHVRCADLDISAARTTADAIRNDGGQADAASVDLNDGAGVRELFDALSTAPDVVATTPAINVRKSLLSIDDEEFNQVMQLNLAGTFYVLREAGRRMAERGRGSLIALASIRAQTTEPGQGAYAATKAGIVQLVRTLAAELGPKGVRVNAVAPGVVDTPLTAPIKADDAWAEAYASKSALGRWARADELAGPIVFLASEAASYVTGALLFVDGGWTAIDGRFTPPLPDDPE